MAVTLTLQQNPPETMDYDPKTGEVTVVRAYEARGAWPLNILGLPTVEGVAGLTPYVDSIPSWVNVSVYKDTFATFWPWGLVTVACYLANIHPEAHVAKASEAESSTRVTITYKGYTVGVVGHELDIGTESSLQKVDLDDDHVDAEGRPRGIGAKGEGVNKTAPKGEWVIQEICEASTGCDWFDRWGKIATLTSTVNETNWSPALQKRGSDGTARRSRWPEGFWAYDGADFSELVGPYFMLTHTFRPALRAYETGAANTHDARWAEETRIEGDAEVAEGETRPALQISFGPTQTSRIYPIAGKNNLVAGRDLRDHLFADLGI